MRIRCPPRAFGSSSGRTHRPASWPPTSPRPPPPPAGGHASTAESVRCRSVASGRGSAAHLRLVLALSLRGLLAAHGQEGFVRPGPRVVDHRAQPNLRCGARRGPGVSDPSRAASPRRLRPCWRCRCGRGGRPPPRRPFHRRSADQDDRESHTGGSPDGIHLLDVQISRHELGPVGTAGTAGRREGGPAAPRALVHARHPGGASWPSPSPGWAGWTPAGWSWSRPSTTTWTSPSPSARSPGSSSPFTLPPSRPPSLDQAPPPPPRPRAEAGSRGPAGQGPCGAGHRPGPPRAPPSPPPAAPPPAPGRAAPPKLQLVLSDDRQTPAAREREAISFGEGEQAGRQAGGGGGGGAADLFPRRRRPRRGRDRPPGPHKPQGASRQEPGCRGVIPREREQAGRGGRAGADIGG